MQSVHSTRCSFLGRAASARATFVASLSFATAIIGGCAANVDADGTADGTAGGPGFNQAVDPVANTTQEAARPSEINTVPDSFEWFQGWGTVDMRPWSSHVCVMAGASGSFRGAGESVRIFKGSNGNWQMNGTSQQSGVRAKAHCWPLAAFWGPIPPGEATPTRWISDEFTAQARATQTCGWFSCTHHAGTGSTWMWGGDAASFLTGISGAFDGTGEWAWIWQGSTNPSRLQVQTMADVTNYLTGRAHSLFVGNPHTGQQAQFWGPPDDNKGSADFTQEYVGGLYGPGTNNTWMAPTSQAMCYAMGIVGGLFGSGESFDISPQWDGVQERWYLSVTNGASSGSFQVAVRCYTWNQ